MEIREAVLGRRSIRGFKADPVPRQIIEDILETATHSPSGKNTQPWEFAVLTGEFLGKINAGNLAAMLDGRPETPDVDVSLPTGVYHRRNVETAKQLYTAMGIARNDRPAREAWWQRGFRYFDAPAVILLLTDRAVHPAEGQYDLGLITQTLALVALDYGLGSCIVRQGVLHTDVIREHTGISRDKLIVIAIALGYPDPDFPANRVISRRVPASQLTSWYGFNENE
jgi:nitroreductase